MFDPTTNRVPFGLLTDDERDILQSWPHGLEHYDADNGWKNWGDPLFFGMQVYRAKPAPVVQTWWFNINPDDLWNSREIADAFVPDDRIGVVRVDVIDGKLSVELEPLEVKA